MITYCFNWYEVLEKKTVLIDEVFVSVLISIFTIPLDIMLLPFELITLFIYKKMRYKRNKKLKE